MVCLQFIDRVPNGHVLIFGVIAFYLNDGCKHVEMEVKTVEYTLSKYYHVGWCGYDVTLRKHAYTNMLKILPPKMNFFR